MEKMNEQALRTQTQWSRDVSLNETRNQKNFWNGQKKSCYKIAKSDETSNASWMEESHVHLSREK